MLPRLRRPRDIVMIVITGPTPRRPTCFASTYERERKEVKDEDEEEEKKKTKTKKKKKEEEEEEEEVAATSYT
ncbi:hypothetical protein HZH68_011951 [Vespula germanica]|uniref:Uncharacterized protein n=1 Tax=Vespula germanica TaxID=30212 RepID=A0A834N055_VESGE|nr:hypothetical protein HZH68_011951 [Vespula germanica]